MTSDSMLREKLIVLFAVNCNHQPEMTGPRSEFVIKQARKVINAANAYCRWQEFACNGRPVVEYRTEERDGKQVRLKFEYTVFEEKDELAVHKGVEKARKQIGQALKFFGVRKWETSTFGLSIEFANGNRWGN